MDTYYDNFGVFYNNTLTYLFTNPERDVVKHNIDNPLDVPRHLHNTRIPNQHTGSVITGLHVGHYFWIFGGFKWQHYDYEVQAKSSLWSLKREVWIDGPEMPEHLIKRQPCATAINDKVVVFINFNIDEYFDADIIPIKAYDFSKGVWYPISKPSLFPDYFNLLCTCATTHDKTHRL